MDFLQLCADLASESGGTGAAPVTVTGQVDRQGKIVNWIRDSWTAIQNLRPHWGFLQGDWSGALIPNAQTYTENSWTIPRFGEWIGDFARFRTTSLYDPDIGRADEGDIRQIGFQDWKRRWDHGEHEANRPYEYCIAPDGSIRFGPKPDKAYVVRGQYRKTPQILAANTDVPDMPARFHKIIVWRAIKMMAEHDEAPFAIGTADSEFKELFNAMCRDLLPAIGVRGQRPMA